MLYITGDTHGDVDMSHLSSRTLKRCCAEQNVDFHTITAAIVLGDFGLPWYDCAVYTNGIHPTEKTDAYLLRWYNKKPFTILAVMGNHDNYDVIEKLPEVSLFGGTALKVSRNIFYLKLAEAKRQCSLFTSARTSRIAILFLFLRHILWSQKKKHFTEARIIIFAGRFVTFPKIIT